MAKKITFDIELNVNGQNMVVRASQDVRELQKAVSAVRVTLSASQGRTLLKQGRM